MNLTDAEKQRVEKAAPKVPTLVEDAPPKRKKIPLRDLHALGGGQGKPMSAADISRTYSNSVVIVASDEGSSGTGFAIGNGGYVLTCAHCVSELQQNWVTLDMQLGNVGGNTQIPSKTRITLSRFSKSFGFLQGNRHRNRHQPNPYFAKVV